MIRKLSGRKSTAPDPAARQVDVAALLAELPMQHAAMSRALVVIDDPRASAQEIASVLESDPALCARALQLANSAHFGMSGKITSVDQAVVALGGTAMRTLVVSTASGMFGRPDDLPEGFWDHSVAVAAASAMAARMYSAGADHADQLLAAEIAAYGANHAALGADALAAWKLPAVVVGALRAHHDDPMETDDRLGRVVIAGEALARAAFDTPAFSHEPALEPGAVFDALGLRVASVDTLIHRTVEETETLAAMLGTHASA